MSRVSTALTSVRERVSLASANSARKPILVAVSKTKDAQLILECYQHEQRHFGENYVQELMDKAEKLPNDIKWHFIGHLQTNKAKSLVQKIPNLEMIHTIDSFKLASTINKALIGLDRKLKILVQVNTGNEETKSGVDKLDVPQLVKQIVYECPNLLFCGLMTIGRPHEIQDMLDLKECKSYLYSEYSELQNYLPEDQFELSMGMSSDFVEAIECGSTIVRVGSVIFGDRDYGNK